MDFLKRFVSDDGGGAHMVKKEKVDDEENIELSLGLSLNGKYGIEKRRIDDNNMLVRASSVVADMTSFLTVDQTTSLTRTCSLPVEMMEDEFRKKKEMQSLRRFEAKRKRVEKMKNGSCEVKKLRCLVSGSNEVAKSFLPPLPRMSSVGSPGSGGSSGVSDLESQHVSGMVFICFYIYVA